MNGKTVAVAAAFLLTGAASFYGGYLVAESKLNKLYNEQMEAEIEKTRKFFTATQKPGTPEEVAAALGISGEDAVLDAAAALRTYRGEQIVITKDGAMVAAEFDSEADDPFTREADDVVIDVVETPSEHNIWLEEVELDVDARTPEIPYLISTEEFAANEPNHDQIDVTWYAGDNVLTDDADSLVENHKCVGEHNLESFGRGHDPNTILVRNERLSADYAVTRHMGKYSHVVLGLQHSDETYERTRRPRRDADG